jgi:hypothetical protein
VRTTINLPDPLLSEARRLAAESGRTLTAVIEDAVRESLDRRRQDRPLPPPKLTTVGGSGLQPGVDLDDSAGLEDLMDEPNAVDGR